MDIDKDILMCYNSNRKREMNFQMSFKKNIKKIKKSVDKKLKAWYNTDS